MPKYILESYTYRKMAVANKSESFVEPEINALVLDKNLDLYEFIENGTSTLYASLKLVQNRINKDYKINKNFIHISSISSQDRLFKTSMNGLVTPSIIVQAVENKNKISTNSLEKLQEKMSKLSYSMLEIK